MTPKTPQIAKFVKTSIFNDGRKNRKKISFGGLQPKNCSSPGVKGLQVGRGEGGYAIPDCLGIWQRRNFPLHPEEKLACQCAADREKQHPEKHTQLAPLRQIWIIHSDVDFSSSVSESCEPLHLGAFLAGPT